MGEDARALRCRIRSGRVAGEVDRRPVGGERGPGGDHRQLDPEPVERRLDPEPEPVADVLDRHARRRARRTSGTRPGSWGGSAAIARLRAIGPDQAHLVGHQPARADLAPVVAGGGLHPGCVRVLGHDGARHVAQGDRPVEVVEDRQRGGAGARGIPTAAVAAGTRAAADRAARGPPVHPRDVAPQVASITAAPGPGHRTRTNIAATIGGALPGAHRRGASERSHRRAESGSTSSRGPATDARMRRATRRGTRDAAQVGAEAHRLLPGPTSTRHGRGPNEGREAMNRPVLAAGRASRPQDARRRRARRASVGRRCRSTGDLRVRRLRRLRGRARGSPRPPPR